MPQVCAGKGERGAEADESARAVSVFILGAVAAYGCVVRKIATPGIVQPLAERTAAPIRARGAPRRWKAASMRGARFNYKNAYPRPVCHHTGFPRLTHTMCAPLAAMDGDFSEWWGTIWYAPTLPAFNLENNEPAGICENVCITAKNY